MRFLQKGTESGPPLLLTGDRKPQVVLPEAEVFFHVVNSADWDSTLDTTTRSTSYDRWTDDGPRSGSTASRLCCAGRSSARTAFPELSVVVQWWSKALHLAINLVSAWGRRVPTVERWLVTGDVYARE